MFKKNFFLWCVLLCIYTNYGYVNAQLSKIDSLQTVLNSTTNKEERFNILNELTKAMIRQNHKNLIPSLKNYITLAKELEEYDKMASKSRFLIQQQLMKGENKKGLQLCDSMLSYQSKFKELKSKAHIILKRGAIYFTELSYEKAIEDYQLAADLFLQSKDSIFAADAHFFSGTAYSNLGDFVKAIKEYEIAIELYEKLKDYSYMFKTIKDLDIIYRRNGLRDLANEKLPALIAKSKKYKALDVLSLFYLSYSEESIKDNQLGLATQYLDSAKKYAPYIKDIILKQLNEFQVNSLALRLSLKKNDMLAADSLYLEKLKIEEDLKQKKITNSLLRDKVDYLMKKNRLPEALTVILEYESYTKNSTGKNNDLLESEKLLATIYEKLGQYKKAAVHSRKYVKLKDSIHKSSLTNALAFHQTKFETAQKEKEILKQENIIQQLEAAQEIAKSKRNTIVALSFSILLIVLGLWRNEQQKKKKLQEKLVKNKEELTSFTNELLQKSKEQEVLKAQLESLKGAVTEKEAVNTVQDLITAKILTKRDWYIFKEKFTNVYPNFLKNIKEKGYNLTKAEERLVALEKLGLDNTEIANMLGVSVESVFTNRYRLRRKINVPKKISLIQFLEDTEKLTA
ncbi:tetratricopeptide repeat protein [Tenacibaculum amylolyticum]|uniref:tetratricopeptide repeat protein n=1 Tax=Tenacibaculum amylolyticum TaxID=104269 RepID=UPI0038B46118